MLAYKKKRIYNKHVREKFEMTFIKEKMLEKLSELVCTCTKKIIGWADDER